VFLQGVAEDEDVVKKGSIEVIQEPAEYIIDEGLEVSRGVGEVEWYNQ
jgi:hypothetical protein